MSNKKYRQVRPGKIALMCKQLAMLLNGGVTLHEAMSIMAQNADSQDERKLYTQVYESLEAGEALGLALEDTGRFPDYMVHMVAIGDTSGKLEEVLNALCLYYERSEAIEQSVRNAVLYPIIMVAVMIAVIAVLLIQALPIFAQVFVQVGAEMPPLLRRLSENSHAGIIFLLIVGGLVALIFLLYYLCKATEGGEALVKKIYENGFLTRKLASKANLSKFASAMSMMLASGINIDEAADMTCSLTDSPTMRRKIDALKDCLRTNMPLAAALKKCGVVSGEYAALIAVGEKTGKTDEMMETVAKRCAMEADEWISRLIGGIEPTIVIIMSLIIGGILISVILPLMNVMTAM